MINYIGTFKEVEKDYIEKQLKMDAIVLQQSSYYPATSLSDIFEYVDLKLKDSTLAAYSFKDKSLHPIVTPGMFISNVLNDDMNTATYLVSKDCSVYIQQGCSENCICTSAYKCKFSVPYNDIKEQIDGLPQKEYISLYGINIGDYDYDNLTIIDLCKKILIDFPNSKLILCNISPYSPILKDLVEYMTNEPRIIPVLYMCVNSGSQKILNIEGHKNFDNNLISLLKSTNIKVVAYLIVGSPEEEREDFEATIEWVKKHRDILLTSIILPYTINGVGNCNQTISAEELKWRLSELHDTVLKYSIIKNNTDIPAPILKNILEVSIYGEDHTFYRRYGFDCL